MLGYVILDLMNKLPWSGNNVGVDSIIEQKENLCKTRAGSVYSSLPVQFYEYMVYCEELEFTQRPDYHYIESLFQTLLETDGQNSKKEENKPKERKGRTGNKAGKGRTSKTTGASTPYNSPHNLDLLCPVSNRLSAKNHFD